MVKILTKQYEVLLMESFAGVGAPAAARRRANEIQNHHALFYSGKNAFFTANSQNHTFIISSALRPIL